MGLPMLPTPMKPSFTIERQSKGVSPSRGRLRARGTWVALRGPPLQTIETKDVVPEDLLLAPIAEGQGEEAVHGLGVLGVAVGIVGGGDEVVVAEGIDHVAHELLVAFHRAEALTAEVVRGRHGEVC